VIDHSELFNDGLQEWKTFHNFKRPLGAPDSPLGVKGFGSRRGPGRERTPSAAQLAEPLVVACLDGLARARLAGRSDADRSFAAHELDQPWTSPLDVEGRVAVARPRVRGSSIAWHGPDAPALPDAKRSHRHALPQRMYFIGSSSATLNGEDLGRPRHTSTPPDIGA
jgi:hypothetical protein